MAPFLLPTATGWICLSFSYAGLQARKNLIGYLGSEKYDSVRLFLGMGPNLEGINDVLQALKGL